MKVGLLLCDVVRSELRDNHPCYDQMFEDYFIQYMPNMQLITYYVLHEEFPKNINECDCWIVSGSRYAVYDSMNWITKLCSFVVQLYQAKKKVLGVCFGHQLMTQALGGKVRLSEKGWGIGVSNNQIVNKKNWMKSDQSSFKVLVSHRDQVIELAPDSQVLASSEFCRYFMLQYGEHFLSIQGHPEFTKEYALDLMNFRQNEYHFEFLKKAKNSLSEQVDSDLLGRWIAKFLDDKVIV